MVGTISDVYLDLRNELRHHGVTSAQLEARELLAFALEIPRDVLNERSGSFLFDAQLKRLEELKQRRLAGEPLAHIIGEWDFYSLTFTLTPDVLIPRADTETLVDAGLAFFSRRERGRILDLCCGSGCVGIALLCNLPDTISCVFADTSEAALEVTKENLVRHRLTFRGITVQQDAKEPCAEALGKFNLIVCNPPYIPTGVIPTLDHSVKDYEPHKALDGGADGLDFYRAIAVNFKPALTKNGMLAFECGMGQHEQVQHILEQAGFCEVRILRDFAGVERVVTALANPPADR
ncbi:MAG TPA: peptide chain release factor N(5)-glutamine methyltransferase [Firmicutes bacterium]|nr:peptide chain release factor N(5)-glutamine methyltransferase [Bacillota bacterium]